MTNTAAGLDLAGIHRRVDLNVLLREDAHTLIRRIKEQDRRIAELSGLLREAQVWITPHLARKLHDRVAASLEPKTP
jgi:3-phosphoglycerate kinase